MALPNSEELKAIAEFRKRVEDVLSKEDSEDDMFLIRWIRAREMDLDKAEVMLRNAVQWRKNNKVDDMLDTKVDQYLRDNYPRWVDGFDKRGHPVYSAAIGQWDVRKVVRDNRSQDFLDYTTEGFERIMEAIKQSDEQVRGQRSEEKSSEEEKGQAKERVSQAIGIFDFDGFPWGQLFNYKAVQNLLSLGSIYEAYYPEILHTAYFINSPYLISKVIMLLKPILAPRTMAKIRILGTNKEEWQTELLKIISPEQLRPQFGGTLIDSNNIM